MDIKFDFDMHELERSLDQLPVRLRRKSRTMAVRAGARVLVKAMKAKLRPNRRTGNLWRSIVAVTTPRGQGFFTKGPIIVGVKRTSSFYAHHVEFGHGRAAAQPFMRPAIAESSQEVVNAMGKKMGEAIEAEARKLSR